MKRVVWFLAVGLLVIAGSSFAARVTNVELSYTDNATVARIYVDGQIRFIHQTEILKDGRPYRVIVDVLSAVHALGAREFSDLPQCPIVGIRTSQYSVEPEKIVRLVFDLARSLLYQIDVDGKSIVVTFPDKTIKPFASWSSATSFAKATATPKVSVPAVTEKNRAIEKDRMASLTVVKSAGTSRQQIVPAKSKKTSSKPSVAKPSPTDEVYGPEFDETPPVVSEPEVKAKVTASAKTASKSSVQKKVGKQASDVSSIMSKRSADSKPQDKSLKPKSSAATTGKKAVSAGSGGQQALASKLQGGKSAKAAAKKKGPAKTAAQATQSTQLDKQSPASKTRATSRFRRAPAKIKGTMVAEFPKRLVIKYRPRLSRDPFQTLMTEALTYEGPVEARTPSVEGLKLVGIIESGARANRALFEDKQGYSYILKSGDKVKKGYVLRVEDDRVYFQIFEYGWSRTVALTLEDY